jgi:hypothetical protein
MPGAGDLRAQEHMVNAELQRIPQAMMMVFMHEAGVAEKDINACKLEEKVGDLSFSVHRRILTRYPIAATHLDGFQTS